MKIKILDLTRLNLMSIIRLKNTIIVASIVLIAVVFSFYAKVYMEDIDASEASVVSENIIILDAGHGGEDSGAIGVNGAFEKDLNLQVSLIIGEMLSENGYTVIYTRTEDKLLYKDSENIKGIRKISDLKNRCNVAKEYPSAVFLSIHMNSFGDKQYSGLQVYYSTRNQNSEMLANCIQSNVKKETQPENNRKIKEGQGVYLLENMENVSVLVECGFLSNFIEAEKLSEKEYQKILSFAIVCGIIEYMNIKS